MIMPQEGNDIERFFRERQVPSPQYVQKKQGAEPFLVIAVALLLAVGASMFYVYGDGNAGSKRTRRTKKTVQDPRPKSQPKHKQQQIVIVSPAKMETQGQLEFPQPTWQLSIEGKILGKTSVDMVLLNFQPIDWQAQTREFTGKLFLDYGINSVQLMVLDDEHRWSSRDWEIFRVRPAVKNATGQANSVRESPQTRNAGKKTRKRVNQLIDSEKRATLGLLHESIQMTISFGAPLYNTGDRSGCYRFYLETAQTLCAKFKSKNATAAARKGLEYLRQALKRCDKLGDDDRKAWSLRLAFDQIDLQWQLQTASLKEMMELGRINAKAGRYPEAEYALREAVKMLDEMVITDLKSLDIKVRTTPLALAFTLYAQRKFAKAAEVIEQHVDYIPELPKSSFDWRNFCIMPQDYDLALQDLIIAAEREHAPRLLFLLGFEFYCQGKKAKARQLFHETLKFLPKHRGARMYIEFIEGR